MEGETLWRERIEGFLTASPAGITAEIVKGHGHSLKKKKKKQWHIFDLFPGSNKRWDWWYFLFIPNVLKSEELEIKQNTIFLLRHLHGDWAFTYARVCKCLILTG